MKPLQSGFTLLEMMVALAIFAVISLAGYQLLQGMLRNTEQVRRHVTSLSDVDRLLAQLDRDLSQATIHLHSAALHPGEVPFRARNDEPEILRLSRRNWLNPLQEPRSSLQRVAWHFASGTLTRVNLSSNETSARFDGITSLQLRFWQGNRWLPEWQATHHLPQAVEVTLTIAPWGDIRTIILLTESPS